MKRSAFTLVEMAVALAVLAILAHLSVRQFARVADGRRDREADAQLETLKAAVWSVGGEGGEPEGYLADTGRLPPSDDGTLSALWKRPASVRPHALVPATAENLAVPEAEKADLADSGVFVPSGWRGPYIRLPLWRERLFDPWGNPVETPDSAGLSRVWTADGRAVAVSHYGRDGAADGIRTASLAPEGGLCDLAVTAELPGGFAGVVAYRLYAPFDGMVTGAVARAEYPASAVFRGFAPGAKILKDSITGVARRIVLRPGGNAVHLKLPGAGQ